MVAAAYQKLVTGFSADAMAALCCYNWPGNIRELQNVVERAVLLCAGPVLKPEHLSDLAVAHAVDQAFGDSIRDEKVRRVMEALRETGGNQAAAARLLGMLRSNFGRLMKTLGLKRPIPIQ